MSAPSDHHKMMEAEFIAGIQTGKRLLARELTRTIQQYTVSGKRSHKLSNVFKHYAEIVA